MSTLNEVRREYDLFERYPDIYGYVFFVLRKEGSP